MFDRFRVVVGVCVAVAASLASGGVASSLPSQASDTGHAHAGHGPDGLALDKRSRTPKAGYSVDAHAPWQRCQYDGVAATTDQADATDRAGLPQVHAVYVFPAKSKSRFLDFAAMFQADARQASSLLQGQYGRDVRWDVRAPAAAVCDGSAQVLDITVFQSSYSARQLSTDRQFSLVANELANSGRFSNPNKKYVAWLDAGSRYCGQGTLWQDTARSATNRSEVNRTTGIVYRPYANDATTGGFCRGRTLLHELGHNLGAVQNVAPNAFDGAHCGDDNNDVMCYTGQTSYASPSAQFDHGNDDYWDKGATKVTETSNGWPDAPGEKLPWWGLNLSKYLCPLGADGQAATCAAGNTNPGY